MPIDPTIPADTPLSRLPNFDPREIPVIAVDSHLPPVARGALAPDALRSRFAAPPKWHPEISTERRFTPAGTPSDAAVLVPLVMRDEPMVLLTMRTANLATHSSQIAFPGGRRDATDRDAADTALREAHEEVGLERELAEVIGQMPTYTTGTQFVITPVVALVQPDYRLTLNAYEVADAFEVPLAFLMNPSNHRRHAIEWGEARREWFSMPYRDGEQERFIWGATAAMLRNFYCFLSA